MLHAATGQLTMLYGTDTKLFAPLNDSTSTAGFSGELVPAGSKFLTTGAAADIWLVDAPDGDKRKYVLKAIRVSPGQLKRTQQQPTVGFSGELVPTGGKFLTTGAAADIWLVDAPDGDKRKYVLKAIRVSPGQLKRTQQQPTHPPTAEQMWEEFVDTFRSRVKQWEPLAHENIVRILGASQRLDLYTEYLSGGAAPEYLAKHPDGSVALRKRMIGDVLTGLNYLHAQQPPVIHGSIRMDKPFVDSNGTTKIGEFGLADVVEKYSLFAPDISQDDPILARWSSPELLALKSNPRGTASDIWAVGCTLFEDKPFVDSNGTTKIGEFGLADVVEKYSLFAPDISQDDPILARWSSPELLALKSNPRGTASDIWAVGCTLFEIISGKLPYCEHDYIFQVYHRILTNEMPGGSEDLLDQDFSQVWELVTSCWEQISEQRPSAHDLWKQHSFQTSVSPVVQ
ncbi:unnamed protein product [Rhizoctonia solani]|uniref:Protein kinase domain-containing protein n=1 Tax=Rhizoctonia solani TaxID=456999 RepID=A0A8H3AZJ5_9AGAM|nr:unnamed protein product [Rhizoctonia solani]